jgi:hypothetical protein
MTDSVLPPGDAAEDGEPHISRSLPAEIARGAWETIRETLPATEDEAGAFVAGMTYAFVIFFGLLVLVTMLYAKAAGVRL